MKVSEIKPNTYQVDFESRQELLKTFLRFQEYYESPEFKHKVFTLEEYSKWYMKSNNKSEFTYYDDWSGCNVPSYVFDFFRTGQMNPLSEREQKLLELLPSNKSFYVIGTFNGGRKDIIEHEICHSLFYTIKNYKNEVLSLLEKYKEELEDVKKWISGLGYHESVLLDECQAYISASGETLDKNNIKYPQKLVEELRAISKKYSFSKEN